MCILQRFRFFIGVVFLLTLEKSYGATQAKCASTTKTWTWNDNSQSLKTCQPAIHEVDDENFTILSATDPTFLAMDIKDTKKVKFLPTNLLSVFPDLIAIRVRNCSVTTVNDNHFKGLSKLKHLQLRQNKIELVVSDAFVDLVNLEVLSLSSNRIKTLGRNAFASLKALKTLYLYDNEIQFLHPKIFNSLVNVEKIYFKRNEILILDENIFKTLSSLKTVDVSSNKVERIPNTLFKNNLMLAEVWFQDNIIKFIDGNVFDDLPNLKVVDFKRNSCLNQTYSAITFNNMKNDIKRNCDEKSTREADLQTQLNRKAGEIEALKKEVDTMKQELLQAVYANYEVLKKQIDAVNETSLDAITTFDGMPNKN